jgi:hypothetical protein
MGTLILPLPEQTWDFPPILTVNIWIRSQDLYFEVGVSAGASCRLSHGNQFDPRDKIVSLQASTINNLDPSSWILNLDLFICLLLQFYAQNRTVVVISEIEEKQSEQRANRQVEVST